MLKKNLESVDYDYYGSMRRHKKTGIWEEWTPDLGWQTVWYEDFDYE